MLQLSVIAAVAKHTQLWPSTCSACTGADATGKTMAASVKSHCAPAVS